MAPKSRSVVRTELTSRTGFVSVSDRPDSCGCASARETLSAEKVKYRRIHGAPSLSAVTAGEHQRRWGCMKLSRPTRLFVMGSALCLLSTITAAQRGGGGTNPIASLKGVAIPQRPNLSQFVTDTQSLTVLGKALFWDV